MKIYLVGGAVRDQLLGRPIRERDWVVVGGTPEAMRQRGFRAKAPGFPVYIHPETGEEYALARREIKSGSGYKGFEFDFSADITLEEDLARRDLTINAIAEAENGQIVDPYQGCVDLRSRCLCHITPAFAEDPLRVLRLVRLLAELGEFNFEIAEKTQALVLEMCASGELGTLSAGRIWRETARALAAPKPVAFFRTLIHWGALTQLIPWLHEDAQQEFTAPLAALTRASERCHDAKVRLAALTVSLSLTQGASIDIPGNWPIPAAARALIQLCTDHPLPTIVDAQTILNWLESVDAWRRMERFNDLLNVWFAVLPDASRLLNDLQRCRDISQRAPTLTPGLNPRDAVYEYRLRQIALALD
jgi:tRNA nucleotidyltransferase (CCA-adding enzyme)